MTESNLFPRTELQSLYEEHLQDEPRDHQVHVNHEECPMGKDTKKRLYLRKVAGAMLAYCHHCQMKGYLDLTREVLSVSALSEDKQFLNSGKLIPKYIDRLIEEVNLMGMTTTDWEEWPLEVRLWLAQYELGKDEMSGVGAICINNPSKGMGRLVMASGRDHVAYCRNIPLFNSGGASPPDKDLLKALTVPLTDEQLNHLLFDKMFPSTQRHRLRAIYQTDVYYGGDSPYFFLTEDPISALKVATVLKCEARPLLGTHLTDTDKLITQHRIDKRDPLTFVFGWFDPDWAGKECGMSCAKELGVGTIDILDTLVQPKEYPSTQMPVLIGVYLAGGSR